MPPLWGFRRQERISMENESRMTARDGFAHQRARLVFSSAPDIHASKEARKFAYGAGSEGNSRRSIVRNGLIGFVPLGAK